jgi:hypothetical protein
VSFLVVDPHRYSRLRIDLMMAGALSSGPVGTLRWASAPFGDPASDRELVLVYWAQRASATVPVIASREIGGQTADVHVEDLTYTGNVSAGTVVVGIASVKEATAATSGLVEFVFTEGMSMQGALYRVTGLASRTPHDTALGVMDGSAADMTETISLPIGGVVFGAMATIAAYAAVTSTHTGIDIDSDTLLNTNHHVSLGKKLTIPAIAAHDLQAVSTGPDASKYGHHIAAASFR